MTDESVFAAALALPSPADRAAFLDRACAGSPGLRTQVEALLAAHAADNPLDRPPADLGRTGAYEPVDGQPAATVGDRVGPYRLMEQIGEGGFGVVFVAEQTAPVRRKVALKVLKPGMDTRDVVARFEAERQALALMDHPNIAKVLDAGSTPQGRPYFAMELVRGVPVTEFCDRQKLPPRARLALFVQVCQAVQHAHQKGVIHRDLKPSNVLVTVVDGAPVPKVIDFGVAKAVGQSLTEKTVYTRFAQLIGTPLYMSPEQAEMSGVDVDTRSDVYALGVLLYELLTGTTPFDRDRFRTAAFDEIRRIIREEEPPRPSARLDTSAARAAVAAVRQSDPARLSALMRGELDWIVMRALEKDRNRRYETAAGFAADVRRYLAGEPVQAVPPGAAYRVRKFARKNRAALAAAAAFAGLLVAAAGVSSWLAVQARRAEATAEEKRVEADNNAREAAENAKRAEHLARESASRATELERALQQEELTSASRQVDLDLVESQADPRIGLLRLARTLGTVSGGRAEPEVDPRVPIDGQSAKIVNFARSEKLHLREFVTAAVLAAGQTYAPLLPPLDHDGHAVVDHHLSPDARTLLTLGADRTARLWDTRTARPVAVLRRGGERVVSCALSPDGGTAVTETGDGVMRFWDVPGGTYRAQTEPRPDRYSEPALANICRYDRHGTIAVGRDRVLSFGNLFRENDPVHHQAAPVELWDTTTGRRVARLDRPGRDPDHFRFAAGGRWVTTVENRSTVVVFAADDGREVGRLPHPELDPRETICDVVSPNDRWVVTAALRPGYAGTTLSVWEGGTWRRLPTRLPTFAADEFRVWGVGDDRLAIWGDHQWLVCRPGAADPVAHVSHTRGDQIAIRGDLLHDGEGHLHDLRTGHRLPPPAAHRFHPDLARFAPGGRFLGSVEDDNVSVIDTLTDKRLTTDGYSDHEWDRGRRPLAHGPGTGLCGVVTGGQVAGLWVFLLPSPAPDIPPDLLELWAQIVTRGELGAGDEFVKWDEPTWERKRRELAARPAPRPDFPFPGHIAADPLHWLRAEYEAGPKSDRAEELVRRAEAIGDRVTEVRVRTALAKLRIPAVAPPPREVKR